MNEFGGNWTEAKMEIVVGYAKAYLTIMSKQTWAKTLYFDGFAGSGLIGSSEHTEAIKGTALRILDIDQPKPFDIYYFVEKDEKNKLSLQSKIESDYFGKNAHVIKADCNSKLIDMARYLNNNKNYRALAFIDPYGMTVNWESIEALKGLGIDLWILVPTGLGVNRLLKNDQNIPEPWLKKLEQFLGLSREEILKYFYSTTTINTLFGDQTSVNKEKSIIQKIGNLYTQRLKTIFEFVSESFVMRNSTNSIMYHFMMATNNKNALKIANDVIKPKYRL
ncbi:three-Cys-motif partner protein TcmP [Mucilaginibacter ginsenosidivorans]|uniref:Three-Cys-motif partner protein TcmP n=1 Tax=Mucilaginibacter ginsenosidivorans TaxID=398053 RepID=A0A5B8UXD3_9SPHI|nr:three-Cys-motif partner protein TcmP [Mucilaginibacter ginsenosidivorans]QEC62991.1 three-Cys-motif partner protein TcmP [Mucilaginibacter ginsenosidivorans]